MSRSYRKPWVVDGYDTSHKRYAKRRANKAVRKAHTIADGKAYRRVFSPWEISDYRWMVTEGNEWVDLEGVKRK